MNSRVTYAFHTLKANLTFNFFVPGNNYPDVRWRQDMSEFTTVNANLGFGRGLRESYTTFPNWQSTWGLAGMFYEQTINEKIIIIRRFMLHTQRLIP